MLGNHRQSKDQAGKAVFRRKSETPPWPDQHKKGYWGKEKKKKLYLLSNLHN